MTNASREHTNGVRRAAMYARVSTTDQTCENQLLALRGYVAARGWSATEFIENGVSGAKERRPALDVMLADVRKFCAIHS